MSMEFIHGLLKTYVTTLTRVVGPTTLTGKRGTLPETSPTDGNAIWLAMNGLDSNPGTEVAPKLTYAAAVAAIVGHRVVHIFRNGYVGDLIFPVVTIVTLPSGVHVQVEDGEIATLEYDINGRTDCATGGSKINGIAFTVTDGTAGGFVKLIGTGAVHLQNCSMIVDGIAFSWDFAVPNKTSGINFNYTFVRSSFNFLPTANNTLIFNSIFMEFNKNVARYTCILFANTAHAPARQILVRQSIFYGQNIAIVFGDNTQLTSGNAHLYELRSTVFLDCNYAFMLSTASGTAYHKIRYRFSYLATSISNYAISDQGGDISIEFVETNLLDPTLPRLYTNEAAGIAGDVNGFRLQIEGKSTPAGDSKYLLSSPFLGAGFGGEDIAPFDETTTGPTLTFADSTTIVWDPRSLAISTIPINPVETTDVRGSYHNTFDGLRREFSFQFESYCNNENARKLIKVMADKGSVKFYPLGVTGSLFTDASQGYFDAADNSFAPASALGYLIPGNWRGFWVEFDGKEFYIDRNDETKFYLVDKRNDGWPNAGTFLFHVRYILVQPRRDAIVMSQDNFTAFTQGGAWREKADTESAAFEYQGFAITLLETENLVENV